MNTNIQGDFQICISVPLITLFKESRYKNMLPEKNVIYKEKFIQFIYKKPGAVTKLKLVQKKRNQKFKHNQLQFETMLLASCCYCGDNA